MSSQLVILISGVAIASVNTNIIHILKIINIEIMCEDKYNDTMINIIFLYLHTHRATAR